MGQLRDDFGRITIEKRSVSFIIHPSYGYRPARTPRKALQPGDWFRELEPHGSLGRLLYVTTINTETAFVAADNHAATTTGSLPRDEVEVVPCDSKGRPLDHENDPDSGTFGEHWRADAHPEFDLVDLNDLIDALEDLKNSL